MKNRFGAMRRLIAVPAIMAASVMAAGCTTCATVAPADCAQPAAVQPATACASIPAPPPVVQCAPAPGCAQPLLVTGPGVVCSDSVALDGSVISGGHIVFDGAAATRAAYGAPYAPLYATTYIHRYANEAEKEKADRKAAVAPDNADETARAAKPARRHLRRKAKEAVRVAKEKEAAARAAEAQAAKPAPAEKPRVTVLPPIVAPAMTPDGKPLATVSDVYTITPGQTYTVLPAPTSAQVVSPVAGAASQTQAQPPAGYVRVLGPSTLGLTADEIDNYSKTDVYGVPPEPRPVGE